MPAPIVAIAALGALALGAAALSSKKDKVAPAGGPPAPTSGNFEFDPNLSPQLEAQALGAIKLASAPELQTFAAQLDAMGEHLTAAALRKRAAELTPPPPPPPGEPQQIPGTPPAPGSVSGLDANMDAQTRQAVMAALTSETDPAKLQGFAAAIQFQFPIAAGLLWAKANAMQAAPPGPAAPPGGPPAFSMPGPIHTPAGNVFPTWDPARQKWVFPPEALAYIAPGQVEQQTLPAVPVPGYVPPGPEPQPAPGPAPAPSPMPTVTNWKLATNADVARDGTQPRYAALLSQPLGTEVQEMHNGHLWKFRVLSNRTDPSLTTFAKDVKGWIAAMPAGAPPAPAPSPMVGPAPAPAPFVQPAVYVQPAAPQGAPLSPVQQAAVAMNSALLAHGYKKYDMGLYSAFQSAAGSTADGFPGAGTMGKLGSVLSGMGVAIAPVKVYPWHSMPGLTGYNGINAPTLAEWQG